MSLIQALMGRRQFLVAAGVASGCALSCKKLLNFQRGVAVAAEQTQAAVAKAAGNRCPHLLSPLKIRKAVLKPKPGFFENRVALAVNVELPAASLWLVGTHLTTANGEPWEGQAGSLGDFIASLGPGPVLVGGDFNHDPG